MILSVVRSEEDVAVRLHDSVHWVAAHASKSLAAYIDKGVFKAGDIVELASTLGPLLHIYTLLVTNHHFCSPPLPPAPAPAPAPAPYPVPAPASSAASPPAGPPAPHPPAFSPAPPPTALLFTISPRSRC